MNRPTQKFMLAILGVGALVLSGCSGTSSKSSMGSGGNGGGGGTGSNDLAITVNTGPTGNYVDGAFTSVMVCAPGSTTNCQTISGILVDTGSSGLRIMASALTVSLKQQMGVGNNPVVECLPFVDGVTWGPVQTADVTMAGETAKALPIQVIGSTSFSTVPAGCSSQGAPEDSVALFGANGVLGVGNFAQDCGGGCTVSGGSNAGFYYTCAGQNCSITTESLVSQVANPVTFFTGDNNGVMIQLPAVTGAETTVSGSLIFGIGTRSNNGLGSATVFTMDPTNGNFSTTFNGIAHSDASFLDTGSNGIYFLDAQSTSLPICTNFSFWYCPTTTQNLSATNQGINGATASVNFTVGNAQTLTANASDAAVNGLAGPDTATFDWGLPFFFGRTVFVAIEGQNTPGGSGPYVAY
ncbi:MAG TPA: DUF3443 domain-containing protein [Candidatus Acidoferrum sp.]|nr:DUF3443 domain-containing protein [Candidatus Acidoferrum sp.]